MKRLALPLGALTLIAATALVARQVTDDKPPSGLDVEIQGNNPWTHLDMNDDADDFQFVIVTDRTGGQRAGVFSRAVKQINLLQPEFVVSVGDLIEGGPDTPQSREEQWKEFQGYVGELEMPFFYVPGNHDARSNTLGEAWDARFGRRYYWFTYKDVMFLCLNANDGEPAGGNGRIRYPFGFSAEQIDFARKALAENPEVRWTVVLVHAPMWTHADAETNGWLDVEAALKDRKYTVFCGHIHSYRKFVRQGRDYYQLATTGGGSRLRGTPFGEFDQIVWVTMKDDGPKLANLRLDSIYPEDLRMPVTDEKGGIPGLGEVVVKVRGTVTKGGEPLAGAIVTFRPTEKPAEGEARPATGVVGDDGSFVLTTFGNGDGAKPGGYRVTVSPPPGRIENDPPPAIAIPEKYRASRTTDLDATVTPGGENRFDFELDG